MSNTFRSHMLCIVEDLRAQGVSPYTSGPPIYRLAWRLGLDVPPPFYSSFAVNAIVSGVSFGLLLAVVLLVKISFAPAPHPPLAVLLLGVARNVALPTLFFGVAMAIFIRRRARTLKLPPLAHEPL